ncbi:MAG: ABC transporter permease, partial [Coriobacteriia bacterium]|nr:ABC transporter permease [Coriobacteriia bacterium]
GSVYSLAQIDTPQESGRDFSHISLPTEWCGIIRSEDVSALRDRPGVRGVSGALLATYDFVEERLKKVEIEAQQFVPNAVALDERAEADLEAAVRSDKRYAALAAEQSAIMAKPEESLTAKDQARLERTYELLGKRRAEIYHERRPDVFAKPVARGAKRIAPPEPKVVSDGFMVAGVAMQNQYVGREDIVEGAYFSSADQSADVAIVERGFAAARSLTVGDDLDVPGKTFRVIGIADVSLGANSPGVFVPLGVLQEHLRAPGQYSLLFVRTDSAAGAAATRDWVTRSFPDMNASELSDAAKKIPLSVSKSVRLLTAYGWMVAFAMALASATLLTLFAVRTVSRRSREIATLRAVGWPMGRVVLLCVMETLAMVALGLVLGVGIAAASLSLIPTADAPDRVATPISSTAFLVTVTGQQVEGASRYLAPIRPTSTGLRLDGFSLYAACIAAAAIALAVSACSAWRLHQIDPVALLRRT